MSLVEAIAAYFERRRESRLSRHVPFVGEKQERVTKVQGFGKKFGQNVDADSLRNDPDLLRRSDGELTNRNRR